VKRASLPGMGVAVGTAEVKSILTRTSGYLKTVASHSLQPYRGCTFGGSLCGVGCYVRHNRFVTRDRLWGGFLEVRANAADVYRAQYAAERDWARRRRGRFAIFLSSSTDPFLPQENRFGVTRAVLDAMIAHPPDELILQTHTHRIAAHLDRCRKLAPLCDLRCHISIESDRDRLPGLPPPASPVRKRFEAARSLKRAGIRVVVTVSPLLPIGDPRAFFRAAAESADAVVIDHFVEGDGSRDGSRTARTALPAAMALVDPASTSLEYRERMVAVAREIMPGRVGVSIDGFAGRFLG
jgi:DNA repair photolyase